MIFVPRPQVLCRKRYTQKARFPRWLSDSRQWLLRKEGPSGSNCRLPVLPIKTRTLSYEEKSRSQCPITDKKDADTLIPIIVPPYSPPVGRHKNLTGLREEQ